MKTLIILSTLFLTGCMTTPVPVKMKFPSAPESFFEPCSELKILDKNAKLSDVAKVVVENYTLYHECSVKSESWMEWYKSQKKIFEDIK
jgi:hypothetical protein